jgi:membrane-associated PAP2 superfamily phosphatase
MKPEAARLTAPACWVASGTVRVTLAALILILLWDLSGLDLMLARWFGGPAGFPLQHHWFWEGVLHESVKKIQWLPALLLVAMVIWPVGFMRQVGRGRRAQLAGGTLLALALISGMKLFSLTSCPWDLQQFGGAARHVSHWLWGTADGGGGRCFPAGHASAGFAYIGGYFVFRPVAPRIARGWLIGALLTGLVLATAQQVRGAHFMSHTLWTAWLCWLSAALLDAAVNLGQRLRRQKPGPAPAPATGCAATVPAKPAA